MCYYLATLSMADTFTAEPVRPSRGLIAILDALGAADYSLERVADYLAARQKLREEINRHAEKQMSRLVRQFKSAPLRWFVFQDTVILVYESPQDAVTLEEIEWFGHVLRIFQIRSMAKNLLFRGAFAVGDFYCVSSEENTVMGPAVRDAARWYERANWMGVHATPRTTLYINSILDTKKADIDFVLPAYPVPMKPTAEAPSPTMHLHSVNWPKGFHLVYPAADSQQIRGVVESYLAADEIPVGAEQKHFHALNFFDHVVKTQRLEEPWSTRLGNANAKNPAKR